MNEQKVQINRTCVVKQFELGGIENIAGQQNFSNLFELSKSELSRLLYTQMMSL